METQVTNSMIERYRQLARQIAWVRLALPIALCFVVVFVESSEHILHDHEPMSIDYWVEVLLFGFVGPLVVASVLTWIVKNLRLLAQAYEKIETFNAELEKKIQVRTAELETANEELRQLDRLKSEFVSLVSHELRTPLTNIRGGLEVLTGEKDAAISSAARETFTIVQAEVNRLIRLVKRILDIAALESGQLRINCGPISIRPIVNKIKRESLLFDTTHPLQLEVPIQPLLVYADEEYLTDILTNLLSNAIKYSPKGGAIAVRMTEVNGFAQISVKDHGMGIASKDQQYIFNQFYRGEATHLIQGYGLGLYFAKKLIEAHGGKLWIESKGIVGEGAEICFTLPIDRDTSNGTDSIH